MLWDPAAEATISGFLETLRTAGMQFEYVVRVSAQAHADLHADEHAEDPHPSDPHPKDPLVANPHAPGLHAADPHAANPPAGTHPSEKPDASLALSASHEPAHAPGPRVHVELTGQDAAHMVERGGELLHAMESLVAAVLRLEPEEIDQLSFDALGFKQQRQAATERTAQQGIDAVRATGKPFVFAPMNSRERRMLHLALANNGLPTASSGDGPRRFVVAYPPGATPTPESFDPPPVRRPNSTSTSWKTRGGPRGGSSRQRPSGDGGSSFRFAAKSDRSPLPPEPRLDPNGNPVEQPTQPDSAAVSSEEERLASLRRAFRKR